MMDTFFMYYFIVVGALFVLSLIYESIKLLIRDQDEWQFELANDVLKCFDGPANTVSPLVSPPSRSPLSATLTIGTPVSISSLSANIGESVSTDVVPILLLFFNFDINDICYVLF